MPTPCSWGRAARPPWRCTSRNTKWPPIPCSGRGSSCFPKMISMNSKFLGLVMLLLMCGPAPTLSGQGKKKPVVDIAPRLVLILPLGAAAGQTTRVILRGVGLEDAKEVKILDDNG